MQVKNSLNFLPNQVEPSSPDKRVNVLSALIDISPKSIFSSAYKVKSVVLYSPGYIS